MKPTVLMGALALLLLATPARADFPDAVQAYDGGDYETAFTESLAAAQKGDADAQYMAGFLYMRGQGTRRDLTRAYGWFTLAARQGDSFAADELEGLAGRLSAAEISAAVAWADDWVMTECY